MNPCPNGWDINEYGQCECTSEQLKRYRSKISSPLLDRIDIQVSVPKLPTETLLDTSRPIQDEMPQIQLKINDAREFQMKRQGTPNALLESTQMRDICRFPMNSQPTILEKLKKLNISARAFHRILKIARTIADLEQADDIALPHILEAMSYRQFDRLLKN